MQAENASQVFGLNWLQDVEPIEVRGAYDPEAELWISSGSVEADGTTRTSGDTLTFIPTQQPIVTVPSGPNVDFVIEPDQDIDHQSDDGHVIILQ